MAKRSLALPAPPSRGVPRCTEVVVQVVVRTYDEAGAPIAEEISAPIKVFRNADTQDFWGTIDALVAQRTHTKG